MNTRDKLKQHPFISESCPDESHSSTHCLQLGLDRGIRPNMATRSGFNVSKMSHMFCSQPKASAALILGHPGHELRVYGWTRSIRPLTFVITDGSGASGISRLIRRPSFSITWALRLVRSMEGLPTGPSTKRCSLVLWNPCVKLSNPSRQH